MKGDEVIERGDILVRNNRIAAIGPSGSVQAPADARQLGWMLGQDGVVVRILRG